MFHPSYAGVTLGLIHGSQPDALVLCHEPTREHMRGLPGRDLPDIKTCIAANLEAAKLVSSNVFCAGIAVNTKNLDHQAARAYLQELQANTGLACVDPVRNGVAPIVDKLSEVQ